MTVQATTNTAQTPGNSGKVDIKLTGLNAGATYVELVELKPKTGTADETSATVSDGEARPPPVKIGSSYRVRSYVKYDADKLEGSGDPLDDDTVVVDASDGDLVIKSYEPTLVDLVAQSLALDDNTPRAGCEGALDAHNAWIKFLDAAYKAPNLKAKDIGTEATIDGGQTSCSVVMGRALGNYGVPANLLGDAPGTLIPHLNRIDNQKYLREITKDTLPRKGDPYFMYHPNPPQCHHAIFGGLVTNKGDGTYIINDYSGGQATKDTKDTKNDAGFFTRPMAQADKVPPPPAWGGATPPLVILGGTGTGGVGEGLQRPVKWFTDMWAYFNDNAASLKKIKDGF